MEEMTMPKKRETRSFQNFEIRASEEDSESYLVEGYASTFQPYVMMTIDGVDYSERIDRAAFDNADMSDVVFRVDHAGPVYARTSNGAIQLDIDSHGLHNVTDLGRTERSRQLYEDIAAGNYPKMSFCFSVAADHYDSETRTRVIDAIEKVFDISPVSFPANPGTELDVSARDYFNGVIEMEKAERLEAQRKRLKIKLKTLED